MDVIVVHAVTSGRRMGLHTCESYYEIHAGVRQPTAQKNAPQVGKSPCAPTSVYVLFVDMHIDSQYGVMMRNQQERSTTWRTRFNWLTVSRATATFVQWAAFSLVVAVVAIGIAPKSPVKLDISMLKLSEPAHVTGAAPGVTVDPAGRLTFKFTDPSFALRMLNLGATVPGLLLVAEIARRMAKLLRSAQHSDPFTARTARELTLVAKITALGGLGAWAVANVTRWVLSSYVLASGTDVSLLHESPLGWIGAGLILAGFSQVVARGVAMRTELDAVI